jgi:hypothetical protein
MMETTKLEFTGDSASLEAAFKRLQVENAKLKAGFHDTAKESKAGSKEITAAMGEIEKVAARVRESTKSAADQEAEALAKVRAAYTMGKITLEQYREGQMQIVRANRQVAASTSHITEQTQRAQTDTTSWIQSGITGLASMAAGYASLSTVVSLVNAGLAKQVELQDKANARNVSAGSSQEVLALNMGGDVSEADFARMVSGVSQAAKGSRLTSPDAMLRGAAGSVASLGETDARKRVARVIAMSEAVAPLVSDTTAEGILGVVGQAGQVTGAQSASDFRQALALAAAAQNMSNVKSFDAMKFASKAGAEVLAESPEGIDRQKAYGEAMAVWAAMTTELKDTGGEASGSSVAGVARKLSAFFRDVASGGDDDGSGGTSKKAQHALRMKALLEAGGAPGDTFMARLQYLQRNPELGAAFSETIGDGTGAGLWRKALDPNSRFAQQIASNVANIKPDEASLTQLARNMRATPSAALTDTDAMVKAMQADILQRNVGGAKVAQIRDLMYGDAGLLAANESAIGNMIYRTEFDLRAGNDPAFAASLAKRQLDSVTKELSNRTVAQGMFGLINEDGAKQTIAILEVLREIRGGIDAIVAADGNGARQSDASRAQLNNHREP